MQQEWESGGGVVREIVKIRLIFMGEKRERNVGGVKGKGL